MLLTASVELVIAEALAAQGGRAATRAVGFDVFTFRDFGREYPPPLAAGDVESRSYRISWRQVLGKEPG